jgi:hypothetical protein
MIKQLKELLIDLDKIGWTLERNSHFQRVLKTFDGISQSSGRTEPNATGSPPRKIC